jgi:predicted dehydrogenase
LEAATSAYPGYSRRLEITGSEGTLVLEGDRLTAIDLRSPLPSRPVDEAPEPPERATASAASPVVADASAHRRVIEDFLAALDEGRPPRVGLAEGRRSVALARAVYESSRTGQPIDL